MGLGVKVIEGEGEGLNSPTSAKGFGEAMGAGVTGNIAKLMAVDDSDNEVMTTGERDGLAFGDGTDVGVDEITAT